MAPEMVVLFCEEYTKHKNKLAAAQRGALAADKAALAKTEREIERPVQAMLDGVPGSQVKDKMAQLEARKGELESKLARAEEDAPVLLHPQMADCYAPRSRICVTASPTRKTAAGSSPPSAISSKKSNWCRWSMKAARRSP